jgi:hypothetical protein
MPRNGDFKKYFCKETKRHYFVLGYFGGGSINFNDFKEEAEKFSEETGCPISEVHIDEILSSRRFKHFKFLYAPHFKKQEPLPDSDVMDNVYAWLRD